MSDDRAETTKEPMSAMTTKMTAMCMQCGDSFDWLLPTGPRASSVASDEFRCQKCRGQIQVTTTQPTPYCRACAAGLPVSMLDEDGTRTDISNRPGVPSHASGDGWWPCPLWQRVTAPTPETQADAGYRATAGDALIRAVNEWMPHATACNRYNCPVCVTLINRLRLAYKVWQVSAHKGATTEPIVLVAAPETLSHLLNRLHVAFCEMVILASSEEVADAEVADLEYEGHAAFNALHALLAGAVSHPQPEKKTTNDDEVARGDRRGLPEGFGTAGKGEGL